MGITAFFKISSIISYFFTKNAELCRTRVLLNKRNFAGEVQKSSEALFKSRRYVVSDSNALMFCDTFHLNPKSSIRLKKLKKLPLIKQV